jgi:REP element-mobilizing transposase RayT
MPRTSRLDAPGVLHHIMIRGIERRKIFRNNKDREDLLTRLEKLLPETQTSCYAWAFIPNHAHFLFRTGTVPIATLMRRLLTGYAVSFNLRYKRSGQIFQNRYKSILCQEDIYLKELVRYIHLNPIRAGIVKNLEELNTYPYCGHSAVMGKENREWQDMDYVLGYFGKHRTQARKKYYAYVEEGISHGRRDDLMGGGLIRSAGGWSELKEARNKGIHIKSDERILGDSEFVAGILSKSSEKFERHYEIKRRGYDLKKIADRAAKLCDIETEGIFSGGKQKSKVKARSLFCYWSSRELGVSLSELSRHLGISIPGVCYSVERGEMIARENDYQLIEKET